MRELCKFDELRVKTDNELLELLNGEIEFGIAAAREGLKGAEDLSSMTQSYWKAKHAHTEVSRLLSLAYEGPVAERVQLQARLQRLSRMLEALQNLDYGLHPCSEDATASPALAGC
jgi:predicted phage-related endonuclease